MKQTMKWCRLLAPAIAFAATAMQAQTGTAALAAKKQLPADQRALRVARNTSDPAERLAALRTFIKDYPDSQSVDRAQQNILDLLVKYFPDRENEIGTQADLLVKKADKGYDRWDEQIYIADELAGAGPSGVALPRAEKWIADSSKQLTEANYDKVLEKRFKGYKAKYNNDPPSPEERHKMYQHKRGEVLEVYAHVYLREGKVQEATALLDQAAALDPLTGELNYLRGEIALSQHRDTEALEDFERAQLLGELPDRQRKIMLDLYRKSHGGTEAGLAEDMDARYASLYPPPFKRATHKVVSGGHTALLELYTGSACAPCVGGDLAVEALLESHPRSELVALAFDQHIPEPDPLSNPSSIARAGVFGVRSTPSYVLDGKVLDFYGSTRDAAEDLYRRLVTPVDAQVARPSGVQLSLTAKQEMGARVHVSAAVQLDPETSLLAKMAQETAEPAAKGGPSNEDEEQPATAVSTAPVKPAVPQLSVHFALVEDQVRYSGENGVRFHRMVVRAVKNEVATAKPLAPGSVDKAEADFDLAEVARTNQEYLTTFEKGNDRFGPVEFLTKDTSMQPDHLAVAAWVQDTATHRVLQAAFVPLATTATTGQQ